MLKIFIAFIFLITIIMCLKLVYAKMIGFRTTFNKSNKSKKIKLELNKAGFAYDSKNDYFYSLKNCWQQKFGYCKLYDEHCALLNIIIHCEPIKFTYNKKNWLIEFWKGQYGIALGAEVGIYNTKSKISDNITFYQKINENEQLPIAFTLKRKNKTILKRQDTHWWLTGFKLGEYSKRSDLHMIIKIKFPNKEMLTAFTHSLKQTGYSKQEYSIFNNTVKIKFNKPHTKQPLSQTAVQATLIQQINNNNCKLFNLVTSKYKYTLDKLEYIKTNIQNLYNMFFETIHGEKFYNIIDNSKLDEISQQKHFNLNNDQNFNCFCENSNPCDSYYNETC